MALLDEHRNGVVLSSILHREQARGSTPSPSSTALRARAVARGGRGVAAQAARRPDRAAELSARRLPRARRGPSTTTRCAAPPGCELEAVAAPTVHDAILAVESGGAERALVPFENSIEGSVRTTLDTLALETTDVAIVGEHDHPIRHSLIARSELALDEIAVVLSHPQANAQCARFIRERLPRAEVRAVPSTADAVRQVSRERRAAGQRSGRARPPSSTAASSSRGRRGRARQRHALRLDRAAGDRARRRRAVADDAGLLRARRRPSRRARRRAARSSPSRERQPDEDRVAAAAPRPRSLHVLRRPRGIDRRSRRRRGDRGAARQGRVGAHARQLSGAARPAFPLLRHS